MILLSLNFVSLAVEMSIEISQDSFFLESLLISKRNKVAHLVHLKEEIVPGTQKAQRYFYLIDSVKAACKKPQSEDMCVLYNCLY